MDDETNGQSSRPPQVDDLIQLCRSLNQTQVKYILIGGFAVILHGFGRTTTDIDVLVDTADENIQKIKKALAYLPDNAVAELEDSDVRTYQVVRIADEIVVDLMAKACNIDFDLASRDIQYFIIDDIKIPVAKKDLLIRMKDTVRPSDKMDVEFLKFAIEEENKK